MESIESDPIDFQQLRSIPVCRNPSLVPAYANYFNHNYLVFDGLPVGETALRVTGSDYHQARPTNGSDCGSLSLAQSNLIR